MCVGDAPRRPGGCHTASFPGEPPTALDSHYTSIVLRCISVPPGKTSAADASAVLKFGFRSLGSFLVFTDVTWIYQGIYTRTHTCSLVHPGKPQNGAICPTAVEQMGLNFVKRLRVAIHLQCDMLLRKFSVPPRPSPSVPLPERR
ncbi:hypothetical protein EVAR_92491_1 [Eumeta japonica]|uniref:Uncharacterized protein n=1 Tax=Eumeta variegata TaxID=151549 RepID=A0A4C1T8S9_EUMVA|nr:hypothetical protein EVAR_92491_1 [Eumeta japonica]